MPSNTYCPRFGLLTAFDARSWSGVEVIDRAGSAVTMPTYSGVGDGLYPDAMALLNGWAAAQTQTLNKLANNGWTGGASNITAGIDEDDRVYVESSAVDLTLGVSALLGFSGSEPSTGAGPYRVTASYDFTRGTVYLGATGLKITPVGGGAAYSVPGYPCIYQDIRTFVIGRDGGPDANYDDDSLENQDNDGAGIDTIRWGLDADGHVYTTYPGVWTLTWSSTTFRDRLGFSGSEVTTVLSGTTVTLTADYPCPGVLVPTRPLEDIRPAELRASKGSSDTSGRVARMSTMDAHQWELAFYVDGPADTTDLSQHYLRRWRPYSDDLVTLYQEWGDSRRRRDPLDVTVTQPAYNDDYTSERDGYRGRILCRLVGDAPARQVLSWPQRLRRRSPLRMTLQEDSEA